MSFAAPRKTFRRAIAHIGLEKTGTTTLQAALQMNRGKLAEQGFHVDESLGSGNNLGLPTLCLQGERQLGFLREQGFKPEARLPKYRKALDDLITGANGPYPEAVVFSSEHISSWVVSDAELRLLREILLSMAENVQIIVYLRRQDRLTHSLISEFVKSGGLVLADAPFKRFEPKATKLDFLGMLRKYLEYFPRDRVDVRVFETSAFRNGDLLTDFFYAIGADHRPLARPERKNESLPFEALWFMAKLNELKRYSNIDPAAVDAIRNKVRATQEGTRSKLMTRRQAREYYKGFRNDNAELERLLGISALFDDDFDEYPVERPNMDIDALTRLVKEAAGLDLPL